MHSLPRLKCRLCQPFSTVDFWLVFIVRTEKFMFLTISHTMDSALWLNNSPPYRMNIESAILPQYTFWTDRHRRQTHTKRRATDFTQIMSQKPKFMLLSMHPFVDMSTTTLTQYGFWGMLRLHFRPRQTLPKPHPKNKIHHVAGKFKSQFYVNWILTTCYAVEAVDASFYSRDRNYGFPQSPELGALSLTENV